MFNINYRAPYRRIKREMVEVPPVCHASWTPADWAKVTRLVEEPDMIENGLGLWQWTGDYDDNDRKLYRRHDRQCRESRS